MADLGDADVMILRNHGLLAMGSSIAAAFDAIYRLELVCKVQVAALSCNAKLRRLPETLVAKPRLSTNPTSSRAPAVWNGRPCCASSIGSTVRTATSRIV